MHKFRMKPTPGETLRAAREEKQLTLLQAAQSTNIKVDFLRALEEDHMDAIPSTAQYRGFVRLYAGYLGLDPQSVLPVEKHEPAPQDTGAPEPIEPTLDSAFHPVKPVRAIEALTGLTSKLAEKLPARFKKPVGVEVEQGSSAGLGEGKGSNASTLILEDIGRTLEQQREALGLSRADVERQTRIREFYIYALERGKLQDLPSTVQGRGMLGNYAEFMNLDSDALQLRFAEALQQRRLELMAAENLNTTLAGPNSRVVKKVPAWRKFVTPDMLLSGGLFIGMFVIIFWGAMQVIKSGNVQPTQDIASISDILSQSTTPGEVTGGIVEATATPTGTVAPNTEQASTSVGSGPVQVVVIARSRAYLRITADNVVAFDGRITPGNVYTFSANRSILLLSGDAAAIQVIYNQEDQGVLGSTGQVVSIDYTLDGIITPTPQFTATPSLTPVPTYTPEPSATPTVTFTPSPTP